MGLLNNRDSSYAYLNNKLADIAHPVGSVMFTAEDRNPSEKVGGTWVSHTDSGATFATTYMWRRIK